ncbi:MAG: LPS export ABC transporter permease LptF [Rhodocyclaceae bacterium]|nr:LPS export ABC transporter permease LptF [Rhodocyclaceae bacterium]MBX3667439.1 LPS export ABC transporter permease LptF [Rhodocyclaceae bacterium]
MLFKRSFQREITNTAAAVFVVLFAILLTTQLVRLLAQAAGGRLASEAVLALLGFGALNYLPVVLSLTTFVAVLMTLSRNYRDSEMFVWFASGQALSAWIRPVLGFAVPVVVLVAALSLFLTPWALSASARLQQKMNDRDDASQIAPGTFRESGKADRVFFVEQSNATDGRMRNVFVSSSSHGNLGITVARDGRMQTAENGDRFVVLENGSRYEGLPGTAEYKVMQFERYFLRVETREARALDDSPRFLSTWELLRAPTRERLGEFLWRLGIPLAALNLALLAIPLSFVNPRAGRTSNMVMALLAYLIYSNLISVSQAWVAGGKLPFGVGVWAVHLLMLAVTAGLFYKRTAVIPFWRRVRQGDMA